MERYYRTNLRRWNELVGIHARSEEYDLEGFISGKSSLHSIELEALGYVRSKTLLHLQCHFGLDTLSWVRLGAGVTGVDFSETAIELARSIAERIGVGADFICSNIYDLPSVLTGEFDVVYTSYGVLCWLHDIDEWGRIVARYLRPGGTFFIAEFHPFAWVFDDEDESELRVLHSYWHSAQPEYYEVDGTYADRAARVANKGDYEWQHSLSDVLNSLIKAGLTIAEVREYPFTVDNAQFKFLEKGEDGYSRFRDRAYDIPLMYSVKAIKPFGP